MARPCVLIRLAGEDGGRWAVPMVDVAEVGPATAVTRVPSLPPWLPGVATWRGRVLAVLDLAVLLGGPSPRDAGGTRMVVLRRGEVDLGLLCAEVTGTAEVAAADVGAVPPTMGGPAARVVQGQFVDEQGPVALLDVSAVLALRELLPARGEHVALQPVA